MAFQEAEDVQDDIMPHFRRFETSSDDDLSSGTSDSEPVEVEDAAAGDQSSKLLMPPRQRPLMRVRGLTAKSKWRKVLLGRSVRVCVWLSVRIRLKRSYYAGLTDEVCVASIVKTC